MERKTIFLLLLGIILLIGIERISDFIMNDKQDVKLYDTCGGHNQKQWKLIHTTTHVFNKPEQIVFENALFRVTCPILREDQQAGHSYFANVHDVWLPVTSSEYGDYTYFIDSIRMPPARIEIEKNTPEEVRLAFIYSHKNYRARTGATWPYQGEMHLKKTIALKKGMPGVFVKLQSIPLNPIGEREIGFGADSPLVYSERVVAQHPLVGYHVNLDMEHAQRLYAVSLPLNNSFYRILLLSRPMSTFSYQFEPDQAHGRLTVNQLLEDESDEYQVFLGAVPFDSSHVRIEAEAVSVTSAQIESDKAASGDKYLRMKQGQIVSIPLLIDSDGDYRIVMRYRTQKQGTILRMQMDSSLPFDVDMPNNHQFEHWEYGEKMACSQHPHTLTIQVIQGEIEIDNIVLLPITSPRKDFPIDIVSKALPEMFARQSHFEENVLLNNTGRDIQDEAAQNHQARVATVGEDKPGFLVFGPYHRIVTPGNYVARFVLKVEENTLPSDIANLEVFSNLTGILAFKTITGRDFSHANIYQIIELPFSIPSTYPLDVHTLETRVYFTGQQHLWVDYIDLFPSSHSSATP